MVSSGSAWLSGTGLGFASSRGGAQSFELFQSLVPPTPAAPVASAPTPPVAAGIEPQAYEALLYGKDIPLFVGGKMLIGGRIIEGPWFGGTREDPTVSFLASHARNIGAHTNNVVNSITAVDARLRGESVWSNGVYTNTDKLPSGAFECSVGLNSQEPLDISLLRFGVNAIAYKSEIVTSWTDIPLKPFGGIVPFPSVEVEDTRFGGDGIPRQDAIEIILDHMRFSPSEYEISVSGSDPAWMIANNMSFGDFLQQLRSIFVNWQITYTDKLRIIEPTDFSLGARITERNHTRGSMVFRRTDPMQLTRQKQYTYIDKDRDYEMNVAVAKEDYAPVPTSVGVQTVSLELPIVTTAAQAVADVHTSLFEEIANREQMEFQGNVTLFGLEIGDGVRYLDDDIDFTGRVFETQRDFSKFTIDVRAGQSVNCGAGLDSLSLFLSANNTFGEDVDGEGYGYAAVVPADPVPDAWPVRARTNRLDFTIAIGVVAEDGEAVFVNDSEAHAPVFQNVFVDDTYVYHVDSDAGGGNAAVVVRLRLDDLTDRTVLDWGTWYAANVDAAGTFGYGATLHEGRIYISTSGSAGTLKVVTIDLSDFTTTGLGTIDVGGAFERALGLAGLGDYVYLATFVYFGGSSGANYVHRININDDSVDTINGGATGGAYRLAGCCADVDTGKVFWAPAGSGFSGSSYPTINERNVGVLDTNVTFDNSALTFFSVLQDTDVDHAHEAQVGSFKVLAPWIVEGASKVRLFCQTAELEVRIASFSTVDYTVADTGLDLSPYFDVVGSGQDIVVAARSYGSYQYILGTDDAYPGMKLLKMRANFASIEVIQGGGTP